MTKIVTSEIVCAAFIGLLLFFQFVERNAEKSTKILRIIGVEVLLWLFIDVISFCTNLSYFPTFLTYNWGSIAALSFMYYCEAYIGEKTDLNPWIFCVPKFLCLVSITLAVVSFVTGNIVAYENGKATAIYGLPIEVEICQFIVIFYPSIVAFIKRKTAGLKSIILFGFFVIIPLFATVFSNWTENDYTIVFTAIVLMAIAVFLQNERRQKNFEEHVAHEALLENSARFFALEDKFEALYDVDLKSGLYVSYSKGEFYQKAINEKLVSPVQFFENMRENVDRVVYEEDRQNALAAGMDEHLAKPIDVKQMLRTIAKFLN